MCCGVWVLCVCGGGGEDGGKEDSSKGIGWVGGGESLPCRAGGGGVCRCKESRRTRATNCKQCQLLVHTRTRPLHNLTPTNTHAVRLYTTTPTFQLLHGHSVQPQLVCCLLHLPTQLL